jgi:hypothetical protein
MTIYFGGNSTPGNAEAADVLARVQAYVTAAKGNLANAISAQVSGSIDVLSPDTGDLVNALSQANPALVQGTGGAGIAPPSSGLLCVARTSSFLRGRRVQGHHSWGPLTSVAQDPDGTPLNAARTTQATALAQLLSGSTDMTPRVWSRPVYNTAVKPRVLVRPGADFEVTSYNVPDVYSVLRSRNR